MKRIKKGDTFFRRARKTVFIGVTMCIGVDFVTTFAFCEY